MLAGEQVIALAWQKPTQPEPLMLLVGLATVLIASCYDGDTCRTSTGERIRLACIDTPELSGSRAKPLQAKAARDHLRHLVVGRSVAIKRITTDRYGRSVAELFVNGTNVQQQLVRASHADVLQRYAHQCAWARKACEQDQQCR